MSEASPRHSDNRRPAPPSVSGKRGRHAAAECRSSAALAPALACAQLRSPLPRHQRHTCRRLTSVSSRVSTSDRHGIEDLQGWRSRARGVRYRRSDCLLANPCLGASTTSVRRRRPRRPASGACTPAFKRAVSATYRFSKPDTGPTYSVECRPPQAPLVIFRVDEVDTGREQRSSPEYRDVR